MGEGVPLSHTTENTAIIQDHKGGKSRVMNIPRTMTPYQMSLLSDIFRILPKEIRTNEDKEKLAPGEIGISYVEGTFYVKDPYTGDLITPNSIEFLKPILNKYNVNTGAFDADTVNYITFYSSIHQLEQLGIRMSPDSIIRQMSSPSILYSYVGYENYEQLGFPSAQGIILAYKINEQYATALYHDLTKGAVYFGHYNPETHMFEGWMCITSHDEMAVTIQGGVDVQAECANDIQDLGILFLRVKEPIDENATLTLNGTLTAPICDQSGLLHSTPIPENSTIMLVYDAENTSWIYGGNSVSPQTVLNRVMAKRLGDTATEVIETVNQEISKLDEKIDQALEDMNTKVDTAVTDLTDLVNESIAEMQTDITNAMTVFRDSVNQTITNFQNTVNQRVDDLENTIDGLVVHAVITEADVTVAAANTTTYTITGFDKNTDSLSVNYGQTTLRLGLDYVYSGTANNQIVLQTFTPDAGDVLHFTITKYEVIQTT